MIANFFQSLSDAQVEYLLISGQATVLYGAATFSEDVDVWINPTAANVARLMTALRNCGARYYKLTPALTVENLVRGHGFHFVMDDETKAEVFLDVMGAPPRTSSFAASASASQLMETDWGRIPTVGLKDLVEIKKTQRLEDYPVISRLVLAWFERPEGTMAKDDFRWAAENIFTLETLRALFEKHPTALESLPEGARMQFGEFARQLLTTGDAFEQIERTVTTILQQRMNRLQAEDRRYWRGIIAELKGFRAESKLMPEGGKV